MNKYTEIEIPVLALDQPWAWLVIRPDCIAPNLRQELYKNKEIKDFENRSRSTNFRGWIGVHANKTQSETNYNHLVRIIKNCYPSIPIPQHHQIKRGGIIGRVYIDSVHLPSKKNMGWRISGDYGYKLSDSRPLSFLATKGQQGIFYRTVDRKWWDNDENMWIQRNENLESLFQKLPVRHLEYLKMICAGKPVPEKPKLPLVSLRMMGFDIQKTSDGLLQIPDHIKTAVNDWGT